MDNPLYPATVTIGGSTTTYNAPKVLGIRIHADQSFDLEYTLVKGDGSTAYSVDGSTSELRVTAYKNVSYTPVLLVSGANSDSGSGTVDRITCTVPGDAIPNDIANFPLRNPGNAVFYLIITDGAGKKIEIVAEVNIFDTEYSLTGDAEPSAQTIVPIKNDLGTVISSNLTAPPTPTLNNAYLVAASATGDWSGQDLDLAIGTGSAWVFLTPVNGNFVFDDNQDIQLVFNGTAWVNVSGAPFSDADALIKNDADDTKLVKFDVSAVTTATTRTITVPDTNIDLADIASAMQDLVDDTTPQLGGDLDLNGKNLDFPTTANISDCLDEDNMASDSATMLATQQSIKAYVDAQTKVGVYRDIYIDAAAMVPRDTNGAEALTKEFATNDIMIDYLAFDSTTEEGAQFKMMMPDEWDRSTIKLKFFWDAAVTASGTVIWGVKAGALGDSDAIDAALGTQITVTDTLLTVGDMHISPATAAVTVGGTPALGDMVIFQVVATTGGTIAVDQFLMGIAIQYKESTTTPVIW